MQHQSQTPDIIACCKHHSLDILVLTETQFRSAANPDWSLCGFHIYAEATHPPEFGVGFAVRSALHKNRRTPDSFPRVLRVHFPHPRCGLLETRQNKVRVSVVAGYAPHSGSPPEDRATFWANLHATIAMAKGRVLLLGDFNAHFPNQVRSDEANENGEALQLLAAACNLSFSSLSFRKNSTRLWTWRGHVPDRLPRILDYVLTASAHSKDIEDCDATAPAFRTDHRILIAKFRAKWSRPVTVSTTVTSSVPRPAGSTPEFDTLSNAYSNFTSTLPPPQETPRKPWLDAATLTAVRNKADLYRLHSQNKHAQGPRLRYIEARRKASKMVREAWNTYWSSIGADISNDFAKGNSGRGLSTMSKLIHRRPKPHPQDETDLQAHAVYFKQIFQEDPPTHTHPNIPQLTDAIDLPSWTGFSDVCPTSAEILSAMASMQDGAPGKDGMRMKHLRSDPTLRNHVVTLIQKVWSSGVIPSEWQDAVLVPIPKKGKAREPKDFRPIMLLQTTSKILTKVIHLRARDVPLLPHQHGFRSGDSTVSAILGVKMVMQQAKKCGIPLCCTFIDLQKAYDWVPRQPLFATLTKYGFPQKVISLLQDLYCDKVYLRLAGHTSQNPFASKNGVRQGCPLSPLLFNIYLDRVLQTAIPLMRAITLTDDKTSDTTSVPLVAYADDIVVFGASMVDMQHNVDALAQALAAAGLTISIDKTKLLRMPDQLPPKPQPPAVLPPLIQKLDSDVFFFQMQRKRGAATVTQCPCLDCGEQMANDMTLRKHLLHSHGLTVSCGTTPPTKEEIMPVFASGCDDDGTEYRICPTCPLTHKKGTPANRYSPGFIHRHWRSAKCHPKGMYGYEWLAANHLPVPRQPPLQPPPPKEPPDILIYGQPIALVPHFNYLGRTLTMTDDDAPAIKNRLRIAATTFGSLRQRIFKTRTTSSTAKLAVTKAVIQAQVVYGSQTWVPNAHSIQSLRSFQQRTLRHALRMHPTKTQDGTLHYPRCEAVLHAAHSNDLIDTITHAKVRFVGHILRRPQHDQTRNIFFGSLPMPGRVGYADSNLLRSHVNSTLDSAGLTTSDAQNRDRWHKAIEPLLHTFTDSRPLQTLSPQPPPPAVVPGDRPPRKRVKLKPSASTVTG